MKRFYAIVPYKKFAKVLDRYLLTAPIIEINPDTKLVLFSDWHTSDGSPADDFKQNILLASHQVLPYYGGKNGWRGIYLGDMHELVESRWKRIYAYEKNHVVLWQLNDLCIGSDDKGIEIVGNHDKKKYKIKHILFQDIQFVNAIRLVKDGQTIGLLIHGCEADIMNKGGAITEIVNWFVKRIWTIAQCFGASSEPYWKIALANGKPEGLAKRYMRYAREEGLILFVAHIHIQETLRFRDNCGYINVGSGTKPGLITAVEIEGGEIQSVYWDKDGRHLTPVKDVDGKEYKMLLEA